MSAPRRRALAAACMLALGAGCGGATSSGAARGAPAPAEQGGTSDTTPPPPGAAGRPAEVALPRAAWRPATPERRDVGGLTLVTAPDTAAVRGHLRVAFDAGSARDGERAGLSALVAAATCEALASRLARWGVTPRCTAAPDALVIAVETLPGDTHQVLTEVIAAPEGAVLDEARARRRLAQGVDDPLSDVAEVAARLARRELLVLPLAPHPGAWRTAADLDDGPFGRAALSQFVRRHLAPGPKVVIATGAFDEAGLSAAWERATKSRPRVTGEPLAPPPPIDEDGGRRRTLLVARSPGGRSTVTVARRLSGSPAVLELAAWSIAARAEAEARQGACAARASATVIDAGEAGALALASLEVAPADAPRAALWLDEAWAGAATSPEERAMARVRAFDAARARATRPDGWADALLAAELRGQDAWIELPDADEVELLAPRIDEVLARATKGDRLILVDGPVDVARPLAEKVGRLDELDPRAGLARRRTVAPESGGRPEPEAAR